MANKDFYRVNDVMNILYCSQSKAYGIISDLNAELQAKGIYVVQGRVSKSYFENRTGINAVA